MVFIINEYERKNMFGSGERIGREVNDLVERWIPTAVHDHEHGYQSELQAYLDEKLNDRSGGFGLGIGGEKHVVGTERGISRGDVVVDGVVGIELECDFSSRGRRSYAGSSRTTPPITISSSPSPAVSKTWRGGASSRTSSAAVDAARRT